MFNRERYTGGHEGQPGEHLRAYNERLMLIANNHDQAMDQVARGYDEAIVGANDTIPKLEKALDEPGKQLKPVLDGTTTSVTQTVGFVSKELKKLLSPADQSLLAKAQAKASRTNLGTADYLVDDVLMDASGYDARQIMKAALDSEVWRQAQAKASRTNLGSSDYLIDDILRAASSHEARLAMKAGLDKEVARQAQAKASRTNLGSSDYLVDDILRAASTHNARRALKTTIDKEVWRQAKNKATRVNLEHQDYLVHDILRAASSIGANRVMEAVLFGSASAQRQRRQTREAPRTEQTPPFEYDMPNFEDMFRDMFGNRFGGAFGQDAPPRGGQQRRQGSTPPPRQERPRAQEPPRYQEVDDIVRKAIAEAPQERWLARADKDAIQRVINSVRTVRKQAEEKGDTVTDRQIYIMYRRKIETDSLDEATKQRLTHSTQIMLALMGGKPSGRLPF